MPVPCSCCPLDGCWTVGGDQAQPAFAFLCGAVTRFYDAAGDEIPATSVQSCEGASAAVPVHLTLTPGFFGDGPDSLGENLCQFSTVPDNIGNWTAQPGGCFDPPSPSGASTLQWTAGTLTRLTFQYANPPRTSGGVFMTFSSPEFGGAISWPNTARLVPGDVVTSNPGTAGRRVRLTYLSGPDQGAFNTPFFSSSQLHMHRETTDNTTPPTRVRLDFLAS